jgi:hypothetical protein
VHEAVREGVAEEMDAAGEKLHQSAGFVRDHM